MQIKHKINDMISSKYLIPFIFTFITVSALLIVRSMLFYYESGDYLHFVKLWVEEYRTMTFTEGLRTKVGTYNPPYMYILNIISRFNISDLILIKIVSVFFDILLANFVMRIVSLKTESLNMHILALLLTLGAPTVILNGSMWGQCDSIYAAFAIGSFYFGMRGKSKLTYAFMALAISFKLQAVFLLPILPVFVFMKKITFKDCYMFFAVYFVTLLPALIAGMPVNDLLFAYIEQATYYTRLNQNMVNLWRFVGNVNAEHFTTAGLYMTGTVVLGLMYFIYVNKARFINTVDYIRLAYLFAVIMPFLLPKMHDRYYFIADVTAITVFLFDKRRWYVPVVTILCSYISYAFFIMFGLELLDYRIAALALLVVIIIVLKDFVTSLYAPEIPENAAIPDNTEISEVTVDENPNLPTNMISPINPHDSDK